MSEQPAKATKEAKEAVIRRLEAAEETAAERLVKKHVPAWVVSGAVHVGVIALAILVFGIRKADTKPVVPEISNTAEKVDEPDDKNILNEDIGVDSKIESALPEITRVDEKTVDEKVTMDNVGTPTMVENDANALKLPGLDVKDAPTPGAAGTESTVLSGGGTSNGSVSVMSAGRSGATKSRLLKEGGGNKESEAAVARGLAWLAKQQKQDGGWTYDQGMVGERAAATGMALLPFLAAGVTHKGNKEFSGEKYEQVVKKGIDFLTRMGGTTGNLTVGSSRAMYAQGIAALPLCEAYGMTQDPALKPYAQAAVNFIQKAQASNGSWGYDPGAPGDTSIVGWQIQVLKAAKLSKTLVVDDRVIQKANRFLDSVAAGSKKAMYGYSNTANAAPGTALTAVGLLCRYYVSDWGPVHPSMIEGVSGLSKNGPKGGALTSMYYYYYATQVVHFFEGEDWKTWNEGALQPDGTRKGGMRDWLLGLQVKSDADRGSWAPEGGADGWFGKECGRLGTTAMCLLTLEVYYRHLPLYKRGADGKAVQIIE